MLKRAVFLMFLSAVFFVEPLEGRVFRRSERRRSGVSYTSVAVQISTEAQYDVGGRKLSLQEIAQLRADAMASEGNLSHGIEYVGGVPAAPVPEGIGCGTSDDWRSVGTCVCGSVVVADAWSRSANGMIYRVRFWQ